MKKKQVNGLSTATVLKRVLRYLKPYIGYLVLALIFAIIQVAATLTAPVVAGRAIDAMIAQGNVIYSTILVDIAILSVCIVIVFLFQWLGTVCTNKLAYLTIRDMRDDAFKKLNTVPLKYVDTHSHGDILSRIVNDIDQISDGLIQGFTQLFTGLTTIFGTIGFMLYLNVTIAMIVIVLTPMSIGVAWFLAYKCKKHFRLQAQTRGKLSGLSSEMIDGQKVVKAFGYEGRAEEQFAKINEDLRVCGIKAGFYSSLTNPTTRFINGIVYAAVTVAGALMVMGNVGGFTIGALSCFLTYANQYSKPFNEITGVVTELQTACAASIRLFELLDEQDEKSDNDCVPLVDCSGSLDINNVDFSYTPDKQLIKDFNLHVSAGQRIAIVGPTGCGKTTLINLLMRFYDVNNGEIVLSGRSIANITRKSLRDCYGMVLQDSWLFDGTVRDNIAYGKPSATIEEVRLAARRAHIDHFIDHLPNGYDTVISGSSDGVSQGQKQLLCIARIMLVMPPMLILDEATSNIDTRTEIMIQSAFSEMMKGRTSFIIAHRLSTIRDADKILVMNEGNVIESGTHDELIAEGGFYSKLFNSQFAVTEEQLQ